MTPRQEKKRKEKNGGEKKMHSCRALLALLPLLLHSRSAAQFAAPDGVPLYDGAVGSAAYADVEYEMAADGDADEMAADAGGEAWSEEAASFPSSGGLDIATLASINASASWYAAYGAACAAHAPSSPSASLAC
jgi:hypothetical protein